MCEAQLAFDRCQRYAEGFCCLFQRQASEVSLLDDPALTRIVRLQPLEGFVQSDERFFLFVGQLYGVVQRSRPGTAPALRRAPRPGLIDEQAPHHTRRHGQEMRPILESRQTNVYQLEIGVVDEGGRIERVGPLVAAQPLMRETAKFLVHQRNKTIQRLLIPLAPLTKQSCDLRR